MRTWVVVGWALLAGCGKPKPPERVTAEPPVAPVLKPWTCTAFVARSTGAEPITAAGSGPDERAADVAAWERGCAALPPSRAGESCKLEAPPDGWSWDRTVEADGTAVRVVLTFTPDPVPYQGLGESTVSQDDACARAYTMACTAAEAEAGCQTAPGFVDGGISALAGPDRGGG